MLTRRARWVGHVECRGRKTHKGLTWGNLEKRDNLEDLGIIRKTLPPIQMDLTEI